MKGFVIFLLSLFETDSTFKAFESKNTKLVGVAVAVINEHLGTGRNGTTDAIVNLTPESYIQQKH